METNPNEFERLREKFADAIARDDQEQAAVLAAHGGGPMASEILASNGEVPFSLRMGAQERKALFRHAKAQDKSMSKLARELLVKGLLELDRRGTKSRAEQLHQVMLEVTALYQEELEKERAAEDLSLGSGA